MLTLENLLSRYWWTLVVRGVVAVLFGVMAFIWPGPTLRVLVLLFALYALVDGIAGIAAGFREFGDHERWWAPMVGGVISVLAAIIAVAVPRITLLAVVTLIAAWAIVHGVLDMVAAIRLRKSIEGEWLLALGGALSIGFGVLLFASPAAGALAIIWWIGAYAIIFGVVLVLSGFHLRSVSRAPIL